MSKFDPHKISFTLSPPTKNDISKKNLIPKNTFLRPHKPKSGIFETTKYQKWTFQYPHMQKTTFSRRLTYIKMAYSRSPLTKMAISRPLYKKIKFWYIIVYKQNVFISYAFSATIISHGTLV